MKVRHEALRGRRLRRRAGFSLPVVILVMGVTALSAAILLDVVDLDFRIQRAERITLESRLVAEGGMLELLNDQRLQASLPEFDDPGLASDLQAASNSVFRKDGKDYDAEVSLIRMAPLSESSQGRLQAVIYELRVDSESKAGSGGGVRAEIYKYVSRPRGLIQGDRHAR